MYSGFFSWLQRLAGEWFLGLSARFIFSSALLYFFWNSAFTKLGEGWSGLVQPSSGAYAQILPSLFEAASYDTEQITFFPWKVIVILGTWGEFVLPLLILLGLFTRLASFGMIIFLAAMTYVDIFGHMVDETAIGRFFDSNPHHLIADQRLFWVFLLAYLVLKGAGSVSLDRLLSKKLL